MLDQIQELQDAGHAIILMLDANATLTDDTKFRDIVKLCGLNDLHRSDPAPSTYIGAAECRIDYIFGCHKVLTTVTRHGHWHITRAHNWIIEHSMSISTHANYWEHDANAQNTIGTSSRHEYLKTGNPEAVATYQRKMNDYYEQHNMVRRITRLHRHTLCARRTSGRAVHCGFSIRTNPT
jgi:hypothetical protein